MDSQKDQIETMEENINSSEAKSELKPEPLDSEISTISNEVQPSETNTETNEVISSSESIVESQHKSIPFESSSEEVNSSEPTLSQPTPFEPTSSGNSDIHSHSPVTVVESSGETEFEPSGDSLMQDTSAQEDSTTVERSGENIQTQAITTLETPNAKGTKLDETLTNDTTVAPIIPLDTAADETPKNGLEASELVVNNNASNAIPTENNDIEMASNTPLLEEEVNTQEHFNDESLTQPLLPKQQSEQKDALACVKKYKGIWIILVTILLTAAIIGAIVVAENENDSNNDDDDDDDNYDDFIQTETPTYTPIINFNFCGKTFRDASKCKKPCFSGKKSECPEDESCFANVLDCNTTRPTYEPTRLSDIPTSSPTIAPIIFPSFMPSIATSSFCGRSKEEAKNCDRPCLTNSDCGTGYHFCFDNIICDLHNVTEFPTSSPSHSQRRGDSYCGYTLNDASIRCLTTCSRNNDCPNKMLCYFHVISCRNMTLFNSLG